MAKSDRALTFLSRIEECRGPNAAYVGIRDSLSFSENAKEVLGGIFSSCEVGYLDEVLRVLDEGILKFGSVAEDEAKQILQRCRVNGCILVTVSVGVALFLC